MSRFPARMVRTGVAASLLALAAGSAWAADFIGPENCKVCHPKAYAAWRDSLHARASRALAPKHENDARCLSCHSPEVEAGQANVTCESCHGGGRLYAPSYVMKDPELARAVGLVEPTERSCRKCHDANTPSLKPFDFAKALELIDHWSAERAARGAAPK